MDNLQIVSQTLLLVKCKEMLTMTEDGWRRVVERGLAYNGARFSNLGEGKKDAFISSPNDSD